MQCLCKPGDTSPVSVIVRCPSRPTRFVIVYEGCYHVLKILVPFGKQFMLGHVVRIAQLFYSIIKFPVLFLHAMYVICQTIIFMPQVIFCFKPSWKSNYICDTVIINTKLYTVNHIRGLIKTFAGKGFQSLMVCIRSINFYQKKDQSIYY